jgi:uncharacterized protein YdeI (YjbR/CyaY-like superfamily)
MVPLFFLTATALRAWLAEHHEQAQELWVGFHKRSSGKPSVTWPEAVDEALCYGWIDGVRKSLADDRYTIRFTPRKPRSTWSRVNIKRAGEFIALGRMHAAGRKAFAERAGERSGIYAYEQTNSLKLDEGDQIGL